MANTTAEEYTNLLPLSRSTTPGPFYLRSLQPRRVLSGRVSRKRSVSLSLTDLNREAIWDEALAQTPPLPISSPAPLHATLPAYTIEAVPSLISSASSTPSTAAFDIFPCTEAVSLPVSSILADPPLMSFDTSVDFAVSLPHHAASYATSYQGYLETILADDKIMPEDQQTSYGGSYAPSPAMVATSAMQSRATSAEAEHTHEAFAYQGYPYSGSSMAPLSQQTYGYPHYTYSYNNMDSRQQSSYGHSYQHQAQHHYLSHQSAYLSHDTSATVDPSMTQGERAKEPKQEARCWEHGCNGRVFSTHSNLLRHMREKVPSATKHTCPKCGAQFTRKTAMRGHMHNDKCGKKSGYNTPTSRSPSQSDR